MMGRRLSSHCKTRSQDLPNLVVSSCKSRSLDAFLSCWLFPWNHAESVGEANHLRLVLPVRAGLVASGSSSASSSPSSRLSKLPLPVSLSSSGLVSVKLGGRWPFAGRLSAPPEPRIDVDSSLPELESAPILLIDPHTLMHTYGLIHHNSSCALQAETAGGLTPGQEKRCRGSGLLIWGREWSLPQDWNSFAPTP